MALSKYLYILFALLMSCIAIETSNLKCEVCCRLVEEIQRNVSSVDPSNIVQVSNFRLDGSGNQIKHTIPLARSQLYLTEVMDSVCEKMNDYVRATFKKNGTLTVMPLLLDGQMNPLMSEVDVVQDSDLNKSLQYYCEDIVNDIEEDLISIIKSGNDNHIVHSICTNVMQLCPKTDNKVEL
ncbi:protein seele [Melanaphis sacchari]|uniref:Protein canopy-1 n=1 Tax=Melanaphis sacchari TaxID=742174 RepID=A0A2H8TFJ5_9HEMI|nr:protein seele [Melanaphis sacchari]